MYLLLDLNKLLLFLFPGYSIPVVHVLPIIFDLNTSATQSISFIKPSYLQVLAALAVSLAPFSAGLGKGYSSPAIASLQGPGANATRRDFQLTDQQASWLASLSFLGKFGVKACLGLRH